MLEEAEVLVEAATKGLLVEAATEGLQVVGDGLGKPNREIEKRGGTCLG